MKITKPIHIVLIIILGVPLFFFVKAIFENQNRRAMRSQEMLVFFQIGKAVKGYISSMTNSIPKSRDELFAKEVLSKEQRNFIQDHGIVYGPPPGTNVPPSQILLRWQSEDKVEYRFQWDGDITKERLEKH